MKRIGLLLCLLAAPALAQSALPEGWRATNASDLQGPDHKLRRAAPEEKVAATGDFDLDGRPDQARILYSDRLKRGGVFVDLSGDQTGWFKIEDLPPDISGITLQLLKPGPYQILCDPDEPCRRKTVTTPRPGLDMAQLEASSWIIWLEDGRWRTEWTSD